DEWPQYVFEELPVHRNHLGGYFNVPLHGNLLSSADRDCGCSRLDIILSECAAANRIDHDISPCDRGGDLRFMPRIGEANLYRTAEGGIGWTSHHCTNRIAALCQSAYNFAAKFARGT